jgi:subtilisin
MKRLAFLLLPLLVLAACQDMPEPLAPSDDAMLAHGASGTIDLIVVLDDGFAPGGGDANRERADEIARGLGLAPFHTYGTALFGFAASVPATQVEALRRNSMVAHVEADQPVSLPEPVFEPAPARATGEGGAEPSSSTQVVPWGIERTGARENGGTGSGVHVFVLDTGIDPDHPDLKANLGEGHTVFTASCRGNPKNCEQLTWYDDHGHGTHVAGTIGALDNGSGVVGVAPEVTLHAVKVMNENGGGSWSGIIAGIDWVAEQTVMLGQPTVANMSLGGLNDDGKVGSCTASGLVGGNDAMYAALCNARNTGAVFAVSAGNTGGDSGLRRPSAFYDVTMAVSATSCRFDDGDLVQTCEMGSEAFTTWSSWGNREDLDWPSEGSLPVAIAAPGANVLSTWIGGDHRYASGTSMAAPHVAGGAALVLAQLGGAQAADGSAFSTVRAALLGATECTESWHNISGNPHSERFLNLRSAEPIDECVEPGAPPLAALEFLRATEATSSSVSFEWAPGSDYPYEDLFYDILHYNGSAWSPVEIVGADITSYEHGGLNSSTTYRWAVRAIRMSGETITEAGPWSYLDASTAPAEGDPELSVTIAGVQCYRQDGRCDFWSETEGAGTLSWAIAPDGNYWTPTGTTSANLVVYFPEPGTYTATVTVDNGFGSTDSDSRSVSCRTQGNNLRCSPID